jgi:RNA polymerase sigma-70 factor (ECF subfamily)
MLIDDSLLLDAARKKDLDALGAIFDRYSPAIYRYTLRLCQDPAQADDITGEVFSRLANQLASDKGPTGNLRAYLFQAAYHLLIDQQRKDMRIVDLEQAEPLPEKGLSIIMAIENKAVLEKLHTALHSHLTLDQQQVIILRFLEGLSLEETALIIGKELNNIKVIQSRAIARLRMALNGEELEASK